MFVVARDRGLSEAQLDAEGIVHPLFQQALYEDTSPPVRIRLHARAFSILHSQGLDAQATDHALRADLVGDPEAIAVLSASGQVALRAGALEVAADRLGGAVTLAGECASAELLVAWGVALFAVGRPADAIRVGDWLLAGRTFRCRCVCGRYG